MIDPWTRELYRYAQEQQPTIYDHLCMMDRELAALHYAGFVIQQQRQVTLQDLEKFAENRRISPPPFILPLVP